MSYFVDVTCKTTWNGTPIVLPMSLGPFKTYNEASTASEQQKEEGRYRHLWFETEIVSDGVPEEQYDDAGQII
jgi:hypothetical protein